jgi:hypothetical protein
MKTLLATAALAIAGAVTVQAAEIFACSGLGYATHNGKIERACTALVTTHWTNLGEHFSALVSYIEEPDGFHVVVTTQQGATEKAAVSPFETILPAGSRPRFPFRAPRARRRRGSCSATPAATWISRRFPPPFPRGNKCYADLRTIDVYAPLIDQHRACGDA